MRKHFLPRRSPVPCEIITATADLADAGALWDRFRYRGGRDARNMLVERYAHIVDRVVHRLDNLFQGALEYGDLYGYGVIGLIDAIEKFDPDRGVEFESYGRTRIQGAVLDELRTADWVPKRVRALARALAAAAERIESAGAVATDDAVGAELGLSPDQVRLGRMHSRSLATASLDRRSEFGMGGSDTLDDAAPGPSVVENLLDVGRLHEAEEEYEVDALRALLADGIASIPEQERVVLALHHREELTFGEIAGHLGVGTTRVCQIHTAAVLSLQRALGAAAS